MSTSVLVQGRMRNPRIPARHGMRSRVSPTGFSPGITPTASQVRVRRCAVLEWCDPMRHPRPKHSTQLRSWHVPWDSESSDLNRWLALATNPSQPYRPIPKKKCLAACKDHLDSWPSWNLSCYPLDEPLLTERQHYSDPVHATRSCLPPMENVGLS